MKRVIALALAVLPFLFSCASNEMYKPASKPETIENDKDLLDIYPGDIRRNLDLYTNVGVGWAGIVVKTTARDGADGLIHATTTFDHHYFDWQQDRNVHGIQLSLSPRGEGPFRTEWVLNRADTGVSPAAAIAFASPGTLAIVYGVPLRVDDGTVVLKYRYLRIISPEHYTTNEFDYGRFGEPFRYIDNPPVPAK